MADIREELGGEVEVSDDEGECLREWVIGLDDDDVTVMLTQGDDPSAVALGLGLFACVPDLLVELVATGMGINASDLGDDERECLREWVDGLDDDDVTVMLAQGDDASAVALGLGILACVPNLLIELVANMMGVNAGELSDDERECLREWVDGLDEDDMMVMLAQEDDASAAVLGLELIACLPDLLFEAMADADEGADPPPPVAEGTPVPLPTDECLANADAVNVEDEHANETEGATPLTVGEAVEGAIDYDVDFDFFVFEAEAGESYQIDVVPGTMWDPVVSLCDGDEELEYSDDYDGLAPRIYWEAPNSGPYYVKVAGWDEGTYTLTIAAETSL